MASCESMLLLELPTGQRSSSGYLNAPDTDWLNLGRLPTGGFVIDFKECGRRKSMPYQSLGNRP